VGGEKGNFVLWPLISPQVLKGDETMNLVEFRKFMEQQWEEIDEAAMSAKNSQGALLALIEFYRDLDDKQRPLADQVIAEWVTSTNPRKRFDALALVEEFIIRTALPQLLVLEADCQNRIGPIARDELKEVRRKINRLETP
jgi:hypothetical protein